MAKASIQLAHELLRFGEETLEDIRFTDDMKMNDAIGKHITVTGSLKSVKLDNGESISELDADNIQYLP